MNALFWFRHDLRLHDNAALLKVAAESQRLLCVYVFDPAWLRPTLYQSKPMGAIRWQFIRESLHDLQQQLAQLGQTLVIRVGKPETVISELIAAHDIQIIGLNQVPATYERRAVASLQKAHQQQQWLVGNSFTLFTEQQLPFYLQDLPTSFTPFRTRLERIVQLLPSTRPCALPASIPLLNDALPTLTQPHPSPHALGFTGGETSGLAQLQHYLHTTQLVSRYKQTRNGLDGWDFSSKFSPWLAQGCLSARQVMAELRAYEAEYGGNESTYWLFFELLWREYFQWLHYRYASRMYALRGIRNQNPLLTFYPEAFMAWREGNTDAPFVNAFMRQLRTTGWMSNRGRQIVASYLINELGVDWRFGAAWFEEQLIDYDPASNWGNWQYLAGVGTDPRGRREFNIAKQQREYDPTGEFIQRYTLSQD
ncbi:MAG: DASH family cryptochrome [Methylococcaceae bacterium]|nr:DASH family cryptochrome [Methylococcaceae bacterium]